MDKLSKALFGVWAAILTLAASDGWTQQPAPGAPPFGPDPKAVVQGSIAYYGTYSIDEAEGTISLHYEGSTYPNWIGDRQKRLVSISGDELRIVSPFTTVGGGKAYLVLKRVK